MRMEQRKQLLPGVGLSLIIAILAVGIERIMPTHVVGAAVLAMFIGISIRYLFSKEEWIQPGVQFTSKKVLKAAIVLLGASLNVSVIWEVGSRTFIILFFTLLTAFGGGWLLGKWLGVDWKLSNMIAAGTGICGGSAIAAISPVIDAKDEDVTYAISATFLFDIAMVVLYPIMGRILQLSDTVFGFWAGTSVNDTSSVVATSFSFSEAAGEIATMVKLTRTLVIIPTVIVFALLAVKRKQQANDSSSEGIKQKSLKGIFPWFIVLFILMAAFYSMGIIPDNLSAILREVSRFFIVVALAAIGLKTDIKAMRKTGVNPLIHGILLSSSVVVVSILITLWVVG